jgi:hypothetical protein
MFCKVFYIFSHILKVHSITQHILWICIIRYFFLFFIVLHIKNIAINIFHLYMNVKIYIHLDNQYLPNNIFLRE